MPLYAGKLCNFLAAAPDLHHVTRNQELLAPSVLLKVSTFSASSLQLGPETEAHPCRPGVCCAHLSQRCIPQLLPAQALQLPLLCLAQAPLLPLLLYQDAAALAAHLPRLPALLAP